MIFLVTILSCNKKNTEYHSITGSWRCEELNPLYGTSIYMVDIDVSRSDTTIFLLSNFLNTDFNEFIYAHLSGSTLTLPDQTFAAMRVKSGTGIVSEDFTTIGFDYNIFDGQSDIKVHANYTRPD